MSYPGPPGVSSNSSHPSLPPRPPAPAKQPSGFKPAFPQATNSSSPSYPSYAPSPAPSYPTATSYSNGPSYGAAPPRQYVAQPTTAPYPSYSQPPTIGGGPTTYQQSSSYNYPQRNYPQQQAYFGGASSASYSTPPQIRNPFPAPDPSGGGGGGGDHDAEMAAQIAQWQSAYMPKEAVDPTGKHPGGGRFGGGANAGASAVTGAAGAAAATAAADAAKATDAADPGAAAAAGDGKKKTVYREGGGKKWMDDTLLEWDPNHLRLFVGNLAGEVTDESLLKAFSRWTSVQKAKVVRDKRTTKSKGYGFVSFSDPDDFFQAAKEMNGKYIQSHPVVVHKAKTEIKPQITKDDRRGRGKNNKKGRGNKSGSGSGRGDGAAPGYEPHLGPAAGSGITKPGQKTRGGLKLLG
ncbi:RNA-binding protein 42 [Phialemonium atrogriseum]|uniref:RNA-binding protein 42 n=1 Tax=Phialemonium atrogriseum TaxID=1093897 RepID=A0AAJ0FMY8_9PEZI|nr:RNA-binding protein 42 [Phialemonium atrogriseum]KAK1768374.1 RNA-binding protein 42 [Phialemonium atrogriseum]